MKKLREINSSEETQNLENIDHLIDIILARVDLSILKYQFRTGKDSLSAIPHSPESKVEL